MTEALALCGFKNFAISFACFALLLMYKMKLGHAYKNTPNTLKRPPYPCNIPPPKKIKILFELKMIL